MWLLIIELWPLCFSLPSPPDQSDPDHFCPVWVGDLASQWRTGLTVCDTNWRRQTTWSETTTQSDPEIEEEPSVRLPATSFHLQNFSPTKKNQHISPSARSVLLLNNQRLRNLLQPYVEIALCLNWIDECIVTAIVFVCLFLFFFFFLFIMLLSYKVYV